MKLEKYDQPKFVFNSGFGYSTDDLNIFDSSSNNENDDDDNDASMTSYDVSPSTSKSLKMKIKRMKSGFGGNHEIIRGPIEAGTSSPELFRRRQLVASNDVNESMSKRKKVSFHSFLQSLSGICTRLTWTWWLGFRLEPIFVTAPDASKVFKSDPKIIISLCLFKSVSNIPNCNISQHFFP